MTDKVQPTIPNGNDKAPSKNAKGIRKAQALKANLAKRKQQQRARLPQTMSDSQK